MKALAHRMRRSAAVGLILLAFAGFHQQVSAFSASPASLSGRTNKDNGGNGIGCVTCHALDASMAVTISGPATLPIFSTGMYTITASRTGLGAGGINSGVKMGMAVAASDGPPSPLSEDSLALALVSSGEVIHSALGGTGGSLNVTNAAGSASYNIFYTMPAAVVPGSVHTLYAVARLGGSGGWKHAANFSVTATTGPPSPPVIGAATAGNAQASVSFTAPVSSGGSPITSYTATSDPGGLTGVGSASPVTVSGLSNGTTYTFTVKATNAIGSGNDSFASNAVIPGAPPGPPLSVSAVRGNAEATVSFTPPASSGTGSISSYTVTSNPGGLTAMGSTSPLIVLGLANGVAYNFTVTATSAFGTGNPSSPSNSVTPEAIPGPPTGVTPSPGNMQATVSFVPPASNGGSSISGYTVTSNPLGGVDSNAGTTGLSHVITALANGTSYTFTVMATNASGNSEPSVPSYPVVPRTVPGAPTGVTATPAGGAASVTFTAPFYNGGSSVTGYTVVSNPPGGVDSNAGAPGLSHVVTNLANGTPYTFTVVATNVAGDGPPSSASASVIPASGTSPSALWVGQVDTCGQLSASRGPPIDATGSAFVIGCTPGPSGQMDVRTWKFGATGAELWAATYTNFPKLDQYPFAHGLAVDNAGNVFMTSTLRDGFNKNSIRTIKYSGPTGYEMWNAGFAAATDDESNSDIAVDPFGNVLVTGYSGSGMRTIKYHGASGLEQWVATNSLYAFALAINTIGDVVVTGYDFGVGGRNFRTIKYSGSSGSELWNVSFSSNTPSSYDTGRGVAIGPGGDVFVFGATGNTSQTIKYNGATGAELWSVPSNMPDGQWAAIAVDAAGNPVVVGSSNDTLGGYNIRTVKYSGATGAELWSVAYNGSANKNDFGSAVAIDADNNVVVTGTSEDAVGGRNIRTIKYSGSTGAEIWTHAFIGAAFFDQGQRVSVGPDNAVYVLGVLDQFSPVPVALLQKLAAVSVPGAPVIFTTAAGNGQVSLSFNPPDSNGGAAITRYTGTCTASGQPTRTNSASASPIVVTALAVGVLYACTVTATNSAGTGAPSVNVMVQALIPQVISFAPLANRLTSDVPFTVSASGGASGNPLLFNSMSPAICSTSGVAGALVTLAGTVGTCTITADQAGNGSYAVATQVTRSFTVTAPLTFTVTPSAGASGSIVPASVQTVVQGGTATFMLLPVNGYAANVASTCGGTLAGNIYITNAVVANCTVAATFTLMASTAPGAPLIGMASAGDGQVTVTFSPPGSNGASPIDHYTATCLPGGAFATNGISPITVTGLVNNTTYTCSVTATNATETGQASAASNPVTPISPLPWTTNCSGCHGPVPSGTKFNAAGTTGTVLSRVIAIQGTMALVPSLTALTATDRAALAAYIAQSVPLIAVSTPANTAKTIDVASHITLNTISFDSVQVVTVPTYGTLSPFSGTTITYTPDPGFSGTDTFTYRGALSSPSQLGDPRTITIMVSPPPALALAAVQSRKTHGSAGDFDILINSALPISGAVDVEPRTIGLGHRLLFQFNNPITIAGSVSVTDAASTSVGAASAVSSGNDVVVTLTAIPDNKRVTVTLTNVNGVVTPFSASIGFLVGDANGNRSVNSSDISGVKARSGQPTDSLNFRFDVNASGAVNSSDISAVKARSGLTLVP